MLGFLLLNNKKNITNNIEKDIIFEQYTRPGKSNICYLLRGAL